MVRAPVVMVTSARTGLTPSGVTEPGEMEQVESSGTPPQLSVTVELKPKFGVTVSV